MGACDSSKSLALGYAAFSQGVSERIVEMISLFVFIMLSYPAQSEIHNNSNYIVELSKSSDVSGNSSNRT